MTDTVASTKPSVPWRQRTVLFMMASVTFLFLSFLLVSAYAWFHTDAAVRVARVGELRSLLVSLDPAKPGPDLAGRVVYVQGTAAAGQPITDSSTGVIFENTLITQRIVERYRGGRKAGWTPEETQFMPSSGARLDGWALTDPLLAATPSALGPLRPGEDYRLPAGMVLADSDPHAAYQPSGNARDSDPVSHPAANDRRLLYRTLRDGPLSVIAAVDRSGHGLVPLRIDGDDVALLANGSVDAATMVESVLKNANTARAETMLWALAAGWVLFLIPAIWAPVQRWIALTIVPLGGILATLTAASVAAVPGGVAGSFLTGQTVALGYVLLIGLAARRRGVLV
ncbi:TMEM43 family protein [Azospirillum sp. B21]|uniref:TMEM43 family protein n=1 Tax=Azospirillum sp. B21 TaxID=2607496 RepID=UPI00165FE56A|nr:TMEM43 family protein [Azospirillum sp. B21]